MKPVLITAVLSAGFLLSGCETTFVDRGPVHHVGYYETGPSYHHRVERRPVVRTRVYETEVHHTTVHRNDHHVAPRKKVVVKKEVRKDVKKHHNSKDRDDRNDRGDHRH